MILNLYLIFRKKKAHINNFAGKGLLKERLQLGLVEYSFLIYNHVRCVLFSISSDILRLSDSMVFGLNVKISGEF